MSKKKKQRTANIRRPRKPRNDGMGSAGDWPDSSIRYEGDDDCEFQLVFSIQEDPASRPTAVPALIAHRRLKERLWWKTRRIDQYVNLGHPDQTSPPDSEAFLPPDYAESTGELPVKY